MKKLSHKDAAIILQTNVSQGSCFDILLRDCDLGPEAGVGALFGVEPFPDRVLANIQGSSYEWFYEFADESFRFYRLPQPYNLECGLFAFVWPEDRCLMDGAPGRYWRKDRTDTYFDQSKVPYEDRVYYSIEDIQKDFRGLMCDQNRIVRKVQKKVSLMVAPEDGVGAFKNVFDAVIDEDIEEWSIAHWRMGKNFFSFSLRKINQQDEH